MLWIQVNLWIVSIRHICEIQKKCSIDLLPKKAKNSDFLSILYLKPRREYRKTKFEIGNRVRLFKYDLPFKKCYRPQFTREFLKLLQFLPENL